MNRSLYDQLGGFDVVLALYRDGMRSASKTPSPHTPSSMTFILSMMSALRPIYLRRLADHRSTRLVTATRRMFSVFTPATVCT